MPFAKGKPKTGGRKVGTPNKTTIGIKNRIHEFIDERFDNMKELLDTLDPKDQIAVYLKFLEYTLPKQKEQKIDLSALSDQEVDALLNKALTKLHDNES
jgi:hypothetical protein